MRAICPYDPISPSGHSLVKNVAAGAAASAAAGWPEGTPSGTGAAAWPSPRAPAVRPKGFLFRLGDAPDPLFARTVAARSEVIGGLHDTDFRNYRQKTGNELAIAADIMGFICAFADEQRGRPVLLSPRDR